MSCQRQAVSICHTAETFECLRASTDYIWRGISIDIESYACRALDAQRRLTGQRRNSKEDEMNSLLQWQMLQISGHCTQVLRVCGKLDHKLSCLLGTFHYHRMAKTVTTASCKRLNDDRLTISPLMLSVSVWVTLLDRLPKNSSLFSPLKRGKIGLNTWEAVNPPREYWPWNGLVIDWQKGPLSAPFVRQTEPLPEHYPCSHFRLVATVVFALQLTQPVFITQTSASISKHSLQLNCVFVLFKIRKN